MQDANDAGTDAQASGPRPIVDEAQLRVLKRVVIGMGVVLLCGFALVIGRIVYLLNRTPVDPAIATAPGATMPADIKLALPPGAAVRSLSLAGNRLAVQHEGPEGRGIVILDLASGKTLQRIELMAPSR